MTADAPGPRRLLPAFGFGAVIALLGGLIGLGGAEFRLPVLAGPLGFSARQAVPLNLAVSLITLTAALVSRGSLFAFTAVILHLTEIGALIAGGMVAAFVGSGLAGRLSERGLRQVILYLLLAIGLALIVEGLFPGESTALVPPGAAWRIGVGVLLGLGIGLVSSLLGVAGGELIIPTMLFVFGADIKTAGTASLLISIPTVLVGLVRYAARGAFHDRRPLAEVVAPMGVGSAIGAVAGALLVGIVPASLLKLGLGVILLVSAWHIFHKQREGH